MEYQYVPNNGYLHITYDIMYCFQASSAVPVICQ